MTLPAYAMSQLSFPEMYERLLVGPLFRPWVDDLLQRVALAAGDRVLDVACGTGIVARVARERLGDHGKVVGIDVSPQMLAVAKAIAPGIDWREGNAESLPVGEDEEFDVVACQQGFQFFRDRTAAAREMHRVMAPRGRVVVAAWRSLEEAPFLLQLNRVAERHVGAIVDARYGFGDAAALERHLVSAGFRDVRLDRLSRAIRFPDPAVFVRMNAMALVGMSTASASMSDEERARTVDAIVKDSASAVGEQTVADGLAFEIGTNVAFAHA